MASRLVSSPKSVLLRSPDVCGENRSSPLYGVVENVSLRLERGVMPFREVPSSPSKLLPPSLLGVHSKYRLGKSAVFIANGVLMVLPGVIANTGDPGFAAVVLRSFRGE